MRINRRAKNGEGQDSGGAHPQGLAADEKRPAENRPAPVKVKPKGKPKKGAK